MSGEIWVAIITSIASLAGVILTVFYGNKLTLYRIEQLEDKVNKHNNLIERTYKLEKHEAEIEKDIESIRDLIDHLHGE